MTTSPWESLQLRERAVKAAKDKYPGDEMKQMCFVQGYIRFVGMRIGKRENEATEAGREAARAARMANPMHYYCAPNQATPDYIAASSPADFIAYGMMCCHYDLQEVAGYTPDPSYYHELRDYFLNAVERSLEAELEPSKEYDDDAPDDTMMWVSDSSKPAHDAGEDADEEIMMRWRVEMMDADGAVCVSLGGSLLGAKDDQAIYGDDSAMWYAAELRKGHKREWAKAIHEARRMNDWLGTASLANVSAA